MSLAVKQSAVASTKPFPHEGECLSDEGVVSTACHTPESGHQQGIKRIPHRFVQGPLLRKIPQCPSLREFSVNLPNPEKLQSLQFAGQTTRQRVGFSSFLLTNSCLFGEKPDVSLVEQSAPDAIPKLEQQPNSKISEESTKVPHEFCKPTEVVKRRRVGMENPIAFLKKHQADSNPLWKEVERLAASRPDSKTQVTFNQSDLTMLTPGGVQAHSCKFVGGDSGLSAPLPVSPSVIHKKPRSRSILINSASRRSEKNGSCQSVHQSEKNVSFNPYKMVFCFTPNSR